MRAFTEPTGQTHLYLLPRSSGALTNGRVQPFVPCRYFSRGGWLESKNIGLRRPAHSLTDWNIQPERLAMSADPEERQFFSHWNSAMSEWAAAGFPELELRPGSTRFPKSSKKKAA